MDRHKNNLLRDLNHIHKDITMLSSGEWHPDTESCEASLGTIGRIISELRRLGVLPVFSSDRGRI